MKQYDVFINGRKTTLQLSDEHAAAMGLTTPAEPEVKAVTPANKAKRPANKSRAAAAAAAFTPEDD